MSFITDEQVEKALNFIRDAAPEYGRLRGLAKFLDHERKIIRSQMILESDAKTAVMKEADAECSAEYRKCCDDIRDCETELGTILTHIKAAELKVEVWRSLNARQRSGHL